MVHLEGEATGAEVEAVAAAPDTQGTEAAQTSDTTDTADFYDEGDPFEDSDDVGEDQQGEQAPEPIEAPVSLKAEEKEKFSQLPREAQQALSEIIQRREQDAQKGVQTAQAAQQQAEAVAADQIAATKSEFAERSARIIAAFAPQPPPIELARQNPAEYLYQQGVFEQERQAFTALVEQLGGIQNEAAGHFEAREQQEKQERLRGLHSIPEFASEETRAKFLGDIETYGTKVLGYSVEQLAQMDATDMAALKTAMTDRTDAEKWRAHLKNRNARPREAKGRFSTAPAGSGAPRQANASDTLKALYPND